MCRHTNALCKGKKSFSQRYPFQTVAGIGLGYLGALVPNGKPFRRVKGLTIQSVSFMGAPGLFEEFVGDISRETARGTVFFVHVLLPHEPYVFDGSCRWHRPPFDDALLAQVEAYERQVQCVDTLLGRFVERLKQEGVYQSAVVVVTGDHGPRPLAKWQVERPDAINGMVARVPLLIKAPGLRPGVSTVDYQHIDFKPTLLDVLGLPPEPGLPGVSALAAARPLRPKMFWWQGKRYVASEPTGRGPWMLLGAEGGGG
ncbi:Lipoteichoic acid synthase 1 [bacterium HR23]|nr:Lipoteichoic acid synthase 1 [bacterium HR23]